MNSYGVMQDYYLHHEPFVSQPNNGSLAAVSTTAMAIMLIGSPFVSVALQRFPNLRRPGGCVGLAIMLTGLLIASWTNSATVILWTQGVMYGIGALVVYFPAMFLIDEWFHELKGLAFGLCWAGTGIGGATTPFLLRWLLNSYGHRITLRVCAVIIVGFALTPSQRHLLMIAQVTVTLPSVLLMKSRIPTRAGPRRLRPIDLSFTKKPTFWLYLGPSMIQSIVAPLPSLWLPSFASSMKMTPAAGPLSVALLNLASCCGFVLQGRLVDRYHVSWAILVSTLGSTVAVFGVWGCTGSEEATLYIFAILFGIFGAGYNGHWTGCACDIRKDTPHLDTGLLLSLLCAGKGVGSLLAGPVSGKLLEMEPWRHAGLAYGSSYGAVIVFTGVCVFVGGAGAVPRVTKTLIAILRSMGRPELRMMRAVRAYVRA